MLICGDSFDHYPTANVLSKWDSAVNAAIGAAYGRLGSQGAWINNASFGILSQGGLSKNTGVVNSSYGFVGTAVYVPVMPTGGNLNVHAFYDPAGGSAMHICSMIGADGSVAVGYITINNFSAPVTTLARSAPGIVTAATWCYIETKVKIHNVSGYVEIVVNGVSVISYTGNTRRGSGAGAGITVSSNNYFTNIKLGASLDSSGGGNNIYFDDFYYCDDTGGVNDDYLGDVQLQAIYPAGAGGSTDWSRSGAATNHQAVNEHSPDDDTTYIHSNVVGDKDLYTWDTIAAAATGIKGLLFNARVKKDDATTREYKPVVKDILGGGADQALTTRQVPGGYVNQQTPCDDNANTGLAWTVAEVNALEAGVEVVT